MRSPSPLSLTTITLSLSCTILASPALSSPALSPSQSPALSPSLPPPEDTPEEILRTEILLDGRSPLTGRPLTAADYAELQGRLEDQLRTTPVEPQQFREIVFQLSILRGLRLILPFLP